MKSLMFEKELVGSGFDIDSFVRGHEAGTLRNLTAVPDADENFEEVMSRAQAAQAFKEFYRHNLSELKYEVKMHHSRMLHLLSSRGERRLQEKKKYKCIGEINTLSRILEEVKYVLGMVH